MGKKKKKMKPTGEGGGHGFLFLVGTPIGNLEDVTLRSLRVLRKADLIAAEDTRAVRKLLTHYDIHRPLVSYYDARERGKSGQLVDQMKSGKNVALVSEAGMPGISDPGYHLVVKSIRAGIKVVPVPGACAALAALVASGMSTDRFVFEGFLPSRKAHLRKKLFLLQMEERTLIFYQSPRRLCDTLLEIRSVMGERRVVVARELTKRFEEFVRGETSELIEYFSEKGVKGEIVLVVEGRKKELGSVLIPVQEQIEEAISELGISRMEAIKLVAGLRGLPKSELYRQCYRNSRWKAVAPSRSSKYREKSG